MLDPRLEGIAGNVFGGDFMGAATSALNMINPTLGNLASSFLADPVATIGGLAEQNGLGGLYKGIMGVAGGDYKTAMRELGAEIGVDPKYLGAAEKITDKVFSDDGLSAEFAMNQVMEFIPVPMIIEKLVPLPQAVPINTGGNVVNATPSSLQVRMR